MKVGLTQIGARALAVLAACCAFGAPRADAGEERPWYEHYTRPSVAPAKPQTAPGGRFFWQRPSAGAHQVERFITDLGACRLPDDTGKLNRRTSINEWFNAGASTDIERGLIAWLLYRMETEYDGLRAVAAPLREQLHALAKNKAGYKQYMKLYDRVREWCDRLEAFEGRGSLVASARFLQKELPNDFSCDPAQLEAELAQLHRSWQEKTQGLDLGRPESAAMLAAGAADYMKARDTVRFGLFGLAAYVARHDVVDLKDEWRRQWDVTSEQMSDYVTGAEYGEWQHASSLLGRQSVAANRDVFKIEKIRRGTLCPEALIDDSMRTPIDVLLVRLPALAGELRKNPKTDRAKLKPLEDRLASIRQAARKVPEDLPDARQALFFALALQR